LNRELAALEPRNPWRLVRHRRPTPPAAIVPSLSIVVLLLIFASGIAGAWYSNMRADRRTVVLVAARNLSPFHQIRASDLKEAKLARRSGPPGIKRSSQAINRYTLVMVPKGKPVVPDQLGPAIVAGALRRSIIIGLDVSSSATLGGRLRRGLVSDVVLLSDKRGLATVTLQRVRVLDVVPPTPSSSRWTVVVALPKAQRRSLEYAGSAAPLFLVPGG
jgi:Flp pilus assembly protein CpaB